VRLLNTASSNRKEIVKFKSSELGFFVCRGKGIEGRREDEADLFVGKSVLRLLLMKIWS
jgi:hypothetical protein